MVAMIAVLWAYDGWNDLTMVAGEVKRPERSLPIALIGGLVYRRRAVHGNECGNPVHSARGADRSSPRPAVAAMQWSPAMAEPSWFRRRWR